MPLLSALLLFCFCSVPPPSTELSLNLTITDDAGSNVARGSIHRDDIPAFVQVSKAGLEHVEVEHSYGEALSLDSQHLFDEMRAFDSCFLQKREADYSAYKSAQKMLDSMTSPEFILALASVSPVDGRILLSVHSVAVTKLKAKGEITRDVNEQRGLMFQLTLAEIPAPKVKFAENGFSGCVRKSAQYTFNDSGGGVFNSEKRQSSQIVALLGGEHIIIRMAQPILVFDPCGLHDRVQFLVHQEGSA